MYLSARRCNFGSAGAFLFAAGATTLWEFGFEGNGTRPSAQDLVYTPLMGMALGELRFAALRATERLRSRTERKILRAFFDPFGELERALGSPC